MPRNRQHIPLEVRRTALLDAATEVFAARGYVATTMEGIAKRASVTRANLYWYYLSKDAIFAAVMDRLLDKEIAALEAEMAGASAEKRLVYGLEEMFPYRSLHREMHERLPYSDEVCLAHETFMAWMRDLVDQVIADSELAVDAQVISDLTLSIFEGSHNEPSKTPAHVMIPVFFNAVLRPEGGAYRGGRRPTNSGTSSRGDGVTARARRRPASPRASA